MCINFHCSNYNTMTPTIINKNCKYSIIADLVCDYNSNPTDHRITTKQKDDPNIPKIITIQTHAIFRLAG